MSLSGSQPGDIAAACAQDHVAAKLRHNYSLFDFLQGDNNLYISMYLHDLMYKRPGAPHPLENCQSNRLQIRLLVESATQYKY